MAFLLPIASTLGVTVGVGSLLLVGGIVRLVHAIRERHGRAGAARYFQSILSIVTGAFMLVQPGIGMLGLTIALGIYFLVSAGAQMIMAWDMGPRSGRGWSIFGSIVSFVLGAYIIVALPVSALWVPGTLLGIDLMFAGATMVGIAFTLRRLEKTMGLGKAPEKPETRQAA